MKLIIVANIHEIFDIPHSIIMADAESAPAGKNPPKSNSPAGKSKKKKKRTIIVVPDSVIVGGLQVFVS